MENHLVAVDGENDGTLRYDVLGRLARLVTTVDGTSTTTLFHYDGDALVGEYRSGAVFRRYVHGDQVDEPLIEYQGTNLATRRYLHADHQGSIVAHSTTLGVVTQKNAYDPYGIPDPGNVGRFGYTGQAWIPELGLNYYKARIYAPKLGRFLQTDPIFYKDDMNLYAYVGNDPVGRRDPSGEYGRGAGWQDSQWKRFERVQRQAANDMERRAAKLEKRADKLDSKGQVGGVELRIQGALLQRGAAALRSDGSDGKTADMVSGATYQSMGGSQNGAAGVFPSNSNVMYVNRDNADGFLSSFGMAKWVVGHESLHTAGIRGHRFGPNTAAAYKFGLPPQRQAFKDISGTNATLSNPDHLMELVYPSLSE